MSVISVEGMEFFAYHGCIQEEQIIGTRFVIDIFLETNTDKAEKSDDLNHTVNYQEVFHLVRNEMEIRSNLLEHIGRRILNAVKSKYPEVEKARIKIAKINPPLGGRVSQVSLTLSF